VRHSIYATQETPPFAWYSVFHTSKESRRGNSRGHVTKRRQSRQRCSGRSLNAIHLVHYLHKEAPRLLKLHGGFGEMTEDHLEQSHQNMDKIHRHSLGFGARTSNGNLSIGKREGISTLLRIVCLIWYCRWLGKFGVSGPIVEHKA
jgi:hypothetical protein